jgi:DNA-directed RNA polymerase specialized sigma24 family protein
MIADDDHKFRDLMAQVLTGSEAAAKELFDKYQARILHAIRRKLHRKIRPAFDSIDFMQDVWASYYARPVENRIFKNPQALLVFLTALARNKVIDVFRQRLCSPKRNTNREHSLDDSRQFDKNKLTSPEPTPSYLVGNDEEWRFFLSEQAPLYRRIYVSVYEGKKQREIARALGIDKSFVNRALQDLPRRLSLWRSNRNRKMVPR